MADANVPFELTTRLFVRELADGSVIVSPVVEPKLSSHGDETSALLEQSMFLREHFHRAAPDTLSRFAVPESTRLVEIDVVLPREDLPRRLAFEAPVTLACVTLPAQDDTWVSIPVLDHVLFVRKKEDLHEVVRAEVRRVVLARDLTPFEFTRLFPATGHRLETVTVDLGAGAAIRGTEGESLRKKIGERARREKAVRALHAVSTPLHLEVARTPPPLVGRDRELADLGALLRGRERLGVLLVGPEDAGKSALVRTWLARERAAGRSPLVYQTSGAQLIAGMSGFGQWQERIQSVMAAAESIDAILYFDDFGDLLAERASGGVDFPGAMKPFLEDGQVRIVGEIRREGFDEIERKHPALLATLQRLDVEPLDARATLEALRLRAGHDAEKEPDRPALDADAIAPLVDLAERYLPYGSFPGKAIRLYEDLRAMREGELGAGGARPIAVDHVHALFSIQTGVPRFLLRESSTLTVAEVERALARFVIGQRGAVRRLAETVAVVKAGLQPQDKPLATFLFVGPTGVGKTELAKALATFLFGGVERMVRFDMSEFMTADGAERLIRGTDRTSGLLTRKVREQPFCLVLLDEIEKAHPAVFDLLLQVAGEGRLTDARGQTVSFRNAILIMTSNIGAADRRAEVGFGEGQAARGDEAHYLKHVDATFRPEFVNRIDRVVVFSRLNDDELAQVLELALAKVRARPGLVDLGVAIEVTAGAKARLARDGSSESMGARALRRHVEETVVAIAARLLGKLGGDLSGARVEVSLVEERRERDPQTLASEDAGPLRFLVQRRRADKAAREIRGIRDVAALRRFADRTIDLGEPARVHEEVQNLTTQLTVASDGKKDRRKQIDIAELLVEHHRLSELWNRADEARLDLHTAEELGLVALFDNAPMEPLLLEARAADERFRRALAYLFVALEPERDAITLMLEELDEGAFDAWLPVFLAFIEARGWTATIHVDGGERLASDHWPADRRWGPPRSPADIRALLVEPKRRLRNLLLRCRGAYAGVFLSLEQGLSRIISRRHEGDGRLGLVVHFVAMQSRIDEADWAHESFTPPAVDTASQRRKGQAAREFDLDAETVSLLARRVTLPGTIESFFARHELFAVEQLLLAEDDPDVARDARAGRKAG